VKVLLDECMPASLRRVLPGHEVDTVPHRDWSGIGNGRLLTLADGEIDAFVTLDKRLPTEQRIGRFSMRFVLLRVRSSDRDHTVALAPRILEALSEG
jgi:hypothetical protein